VDVVKLLLDRGAEHTSEVVFQSADTGGVDIVYYNKLTEMGTQASFSYSIDGSTVKGPLEELQGTPLTIAILKENNESIELLLAAQSKVADGQGKLVKNKAGEVAYDDYVGKYMYGLVPITVTKEKDRLYIQFLGQPKLEIFPRSEIEFEFFFKDENEKIVFMRNDQGEVIKAFLGEMELTKVK
jgi:hypothetical protein